MPHYTIKWTNRSHSIQDWDIDIPDSFQLHPNHSRHAGVTVNNDHTFQIAVTTNGGVAAANLIYTAATDSWNLTSNTPNEWQLHVAGNDVRVTCYLEDIHTASGIQYEAKTPALESND